MYQTFYPVLINCNSITIPLCTTWKFVVINLYNKLTHFKPRGSRKRDISLLHNSLHLDLHVFFPSADSGCSHVGLRAVCVLNYELIVGNLSRFYLHLRLLCQTADKFNVHITRYFVRPTSQPF